MERRKTRQIQLGNVKIGGGAPVAAILCAVPYPIWQLQKA